MTGGREIVVVIALEDVGQLDQHDLVRASLHVVNVGGERDPMQLSDKRVRHHVQLRMVERRVALEASDAVRLGRVDFADDRADAGFGVDASALEALLLRLNCGAAADMVVAMRLGSSVSSQCGHQQREMQQSDSTD